LSRN